MGSTKAMQVMWPWEGLWLLARCGHSEVEWLSRFGVCLFPILGFYLKFTFLRRFVDFS